jgi:hypothetical protein
MVVFFDADEKLSSIRVSKCGNRCSQSSWTDIN